MNPSPAMSSARSIRWRNWAALVLGVFGLTAMFGDVTGVRTLKGLGMASMTAPCPKVFCDMNGYEGFACKFTIHYEIAGEQHKLPITPELYSRLTGPYNRRNVYGAALVGAPILPEPLWQSVFQFGFQPDGPLRQEFGVPRDATNLCVVIQTRTRNRNDQWILKPAWKK